MLAVVAGVSLKYFVAERMIKSARAYERERGRGGDEIVNRCLLRYVRRCMLDSVLECIREGIETQRYP